MSVDLIQHASIAGELARNLWGRTDFEKYDAAWARAQNWTVDYRGGLFTRAGLEFGDIIQWTEGQGIKFIEFQFAPDTANTYVVILTDDKARFVQDNAYVLETAGSVTGVTNGAGNKVTLAVTAHGYSNGDWVKLSGFTHASLLFLNGRTVKVANQTANDFTIQDPITGTDITDIISTGTGLVARIYTIVSPYGQEHLARLQAKQLRDFVRLTHPDFPIYNLIRNGATNWVISAEVIGTSTPTLTGLAVASASASTSDGWVYMVTAVNEDGEEGLADIIVYQDGPDLTNTANLFINLTWTAVAGAVFYRIYRSRAVRTVSGDVLISDAPTGYIGQSTGNTFSDPGITPDFTKRPPLAYNPFANGSIKYVTVVAGGTGAQYDSPITWPAGGSGAYGFLVCGNAAGGNVIQGVKVLNGGKDYTGTSITVAAAAGETLTAELTPATGNNPHCCAVFQQRMVYGATDNFPLRVFGSRTGQLSNFDISDEIVQDDDSYEFDLDAEKVSPIRHLFPVRNGILVFNQLGVWILNGRNNAALSSNSAQANPQNSAGSSFVPPVQVDTNVMFVTDAGQEIQQLAYTEDSQVFLNQNVSLLSNHLFSPTIEVKAITWAPVPFKVLYAVQENGRLLSLSLDAANGVYACTPNWTKGFFRDCLAVLEESESRLYVAVERTVSSTKVLYFERLRPRRQTVLEDAFCVDAGLELTKTYPSGRLVPSSFTGAVTFTAVGATPFVSGDVGKILRCGSGKATITGFTSSTVITGTWSRTLTEAMPEDDTAPMQFLSGEWTLDSAITVLRGLWHLEGLSVTGLADGVVFTSTVLNGSITLSTAASRVSIGLGFKAIAQTLPVTTEDLVMEGRRKAIVGVALRIHETGGLKYGKNLTNLYALADRARRLWPSTYGARLRSEIVYEVHKGTWERDESVFFVQDQPMPAAILNFVRDIDLGDGKGPVRGDDV